MTDWHAPNQQSVGVDPASPGGVPPPGGGDSPTGAYDPAVHTAVDVVAYAQAHPDEVDAILAAELAGKNRTTVVTALGG